MKSASSHFGFSFSQPLHQIRRQFGSYDLILGADRQSRLAAEVGWARWESVRSQWVSVGGGCRTIAQLVGDRTATQLRFQHLQTSRYCKD